MLNVMVTCVRCEERRVESWGRSWEEVRYSVKGECSRRFLSAAVSCVRERECEQERMV